MGTWTQGKDDWKTLSDSLPHGCDFLSIAIRILSDVYQLWEAAGHEIKKRLC